MHEYAAHRLRENHSGLNGAVLGLHRQASDLRDALASDCLTWWPEIGIGYYPVAGSPYDQEYFDRFARQAEDAIGKRLMQSREEFVRKHYAGLLVDVGIGCGAFIKLRNALAGAAVTTGFDINPAGIYWLKSRGLWLDPYQERVRAITLWDVLEHIRDFRPLLANVESHVFVAIPIFTDAHHVLRSKHYRKDEHFWFFTRDGLVNVMGGLGFRLIDESNMETDAGREDIGAFAFERKS
jgi:hypothetical protein